MNFAVFLAAGLLIVSVHAEASASYLQHGGARTGTIDLMLAAAGDPEPTGSARERLEYAAPEPLDTLPYGAGYEARFERPQRIERPERPLPAPGARGPDRPDRPDRGPGRGR